MTTGPIRWEQHDDGIVVLTLDDPAQSANTMNDAFKGAFGEVVDRLEADRDTITGVVITSAKKTFFAGGDLRRLRTIRPEDAETFAASTREMKARLRRLERLGLPVVAAINGAALGGGLEICLACHHRVATRDPKIQIGLPEAGLGLLPGGGGLVRTVRMLGVLPALNDMLLLGQRRRPAEALDRGLVDELVDEAAALLPAAKAWIAANPEAAQPWDRPGHEIPGGIPTADDVVQRLPGAVRRQLRSGAWPAPRNIVSAACEGAAVGFDEAIEVEGRYFVELATGQVAKNMIQAFFFDTQQVNGSRRRPEDLPRFAPRKAVVLGAGMMGAGIAYVCASAGMDVVLKDVSLDAAQRGRDHSRKLLDAAVARGTATEEAAGAVLGRIRPSADAADAADADLVIEAVFEDPAVKAAVFAEIEPRVAPEALIGLNTSTLPITGLAADSARPADVVGLHFFSPVDRMALLEVIKLGTTSETTLHRALDVARLIKKTPIVVNGSRGCFTSRVIGTFISEGIGMLDEGIPAARIEEASVVAGYSTPVLQLAEEMGLAPTREIPEERRAAPEVPRRDLADRMLFVQALEAVRCLDEGVIDSTADANVGSILGIGYPSWTGGVVQFINGHPGGTAGFVQRADELAARYGPRFVVPPSLRALAAQDAPIADRQLVGA